MPRTYTERVLHCNMINPDTNPNLGTPGWGSYFQDQHILDPLLPYFDTLGLPWNAFGSAPNWQNGGPSQMWPSLFKILRDHGKNVLIEGGYIYNRIARGMSGSLNGVTVALDIDTVRMNQMMALGCPRPRLVMDGFPVLMAIQVTSSGGSTPVFAQGDFQAELVNYVSSMQAGFPGMQIGLDVNLASWQAFGSPSYFGPVGATQPTGTATVGSYTYFFNNGVTPDYSTVLSHVGVPEGLIQTLADPMFNLPPFAFFEADYPYEFFMGYNVHNAVNPAGPNWTGSSAIDWGNQLLLLQSLVQANGIPFCPQYNAFYAGSNGPDSRYYYECLDYQAQYLRRGGNPNRFEVIDFTLPTPSALLPVTQYNPFAYSLGSLQQAMFNGDPTNTPVFQLFASGFKPEYLFIDNMTSRAFYLTGGYADSGIAFLLPSDQLQWQQEQEPLNPVVPLLRVIKGIDVIVNPSASFIQGLINSGWTPTPCKGWVAALTATNPPLPNN